MTDIMGFGWFGRLQTCNIVVPLSVGRRNPRVFMSYEFKPTIMKTTAQGSVVFLLLAVALPLSAQLTVQRAIHYEQITAFDTNLFISSMKISGDASAIVFSTSGTAVKVFTMAIDGTNLTEVYDFQRNGYGVWVDISVSGDKIIWCDGYGEIFIANKDGSDREAIATLLPNPNPDFGDITPTFPVPPRINAQGTQVFFLNAEREAQASGLWHVDADGGNIAQEFNYLDVASEVFSTDGSEYNYNTAYSDGFDISADGSYALFGTRIFQLQQGQLEKGDAIVYHSGDFTLISDYATGIQPFATYPDGDHYMLFRRETNAETQAEEVGLYAMHLLGGAETRIMGGLGIFSYPKMVQLTSTGDQGIVLAGGGVPYTPPISYVSSQPNYYFDLVNSDDVSIAFGGYRLSEAYLPSISLTGHYFCFLAPSVPPQIWVGHITGSATDEDPSISNVLLGKDEILLDGSSTTGIEAEVHTYQGTIEKVAVTAFLDGAYQFRAITSDFPALALVNDESLGDVDSTDYRFTNHTIRSDINARVGEYAFRIAAGNTTRREITAADFYPLHIVETFSTNLLVPDPSGFSLIEVVPNPVADGASIRLTLMQPTVVRIDLLDMQGRHLQCIREATLPAGQNQIEWQPQQLPGTYMLRIQTQFETTCIRLLLME